jgi:parallel beta-helix repeat protein
MHVLTLFFLLLLTTALVGSPLSAQLSPRAGAREGSTAQHRPILVSPRTVTVVAGGVEQFSATAIGDAALQWDATGGMITDTGLFMAGPTPGTYTVTGQTSSAAATVSVTIVPAGQSAPAPRHYVSIHPGENIQAAVNANPEGTSFLIKSGVHRRQTVRPKSGMSFIGEAGAVLDGENATGYAFQGHLTRNVTIRGLHVTRYAPPNLTAAVDAVETHGWVIEGNEIDHNSNGMQRVYGVRLGSNGAVRGNAIHHNGWLAINCYNETDTVIEGNEIYANPPALFEDTIGEAANMKLFDCGRIVIRGNDVHDGPFRGIWVDTMRPDVTIEGNRVSNHGAQGIWYEVSYRGVVRDNYVENAGYLGRYRSDWPTDAGIQVTNSPDVSVIGNTVVNSLNGIMGHQAASYSHGSYGRNELRNLLVEGNTIVMPRGQSGIVHNVGANDVYVSWNNRFVRNRYVLGQNASPFFWMGRSVDERAWQAYGQGANESYTR